MPYDVVIIGGGLSGLTAAMRLLEQGVSNICVLEAKARVGGRSFAGEIDSHLGPCIVDLGGQWLGPTQYHALKMVEQLGLETYPQFEEGYSLTRLSDGKIRRYKGTIPDVDYVSLLELQFLIWHMNGLMNTVNIDDPSLTPNAEVWDQQTAASVVNAKLWSSSARELIHAGMRVVFGCELSEMSFLYFLWYVKSAGGIEALIDSRGGAQDRKIKGSAYQMCTRIADIVTADRIKLGTVVRQVVQDDTCVHVTTAAGEVYQAKYVIISTPPHITASLDFTPRLPIKRLRLLQSSLPGNYMKFFVTYTTAFWRDAGLSGTIVDNTSLLSCTFDVCTPEGVNAILVFVAGRFNLEWTDCSEKERHDAILAALAEFLGPQALDPIGCREYNWTVEPHNGGCPAVHVAPGVLAACGSAMRAPCGRIHWAGTESATEWSGYLSGAIQAGDRASHEVADRLKGATPPPPPPQRYYRTTPTTTTTPLLYVLAAAVAVLGYYYYQASI